MDIVCGILQARILEWIAFPFSRGSSWPRNRTGVSCIAGGFFTNWAIRKAPISSERCLLACLLSHFSHVQLSAIPWTTAHQAPLSMGSSTQKYWSGLPFPSPVIKYEVSEVSEEKSLSRVWLFATPWTAAYQAPLSMGFSRQEYWRGLPFPSPMRDEIK